MKKQRTPHSPDYCHWHFDDFWWEYSKMRDGRQTITREEAWRLYAEAREMGRGEIKEKKGKR